MEIIVHNPPVAEPPRVASVKIEWGTFPLEGVSVLFVARGSLSVRARDGERFVLGQGDLLCLGPGCACTAGDARSLGEAIVFRPDHPWVGLALAVAGEKRPPSEGQLSVDRAGTDVARTGERLLRSLLLPPRGSGVAAGLREAAALLELAALALEVRPEAVLVHSVRRAAAVRRSGVVDTLRDLSEGSLYAVSLRNLAQRVNLSERQVSRLVRVALGISFREFVCGVRIERARKLLVESDLAVIEIAAESGWSSLSHFNTVFRSRVGVTPTQFRAKLRRQGSGR